ncbi:MAG: prepilin-type N-terminal cleavage/methylation domain-containing protein [Candidatus Omnitrophota bacterium]
MKIFRQLSKRGFTLVEIMIVVAIIGLLAAIAIPNFIQAQQTAQTNACIANLKQLDGAKTLWALDNGVTSGVPVMTDLVPTYIKSTPTCPGKGAYTIGDVAVAPTCDHSSGLHVLPA